MKNHHANSYHQHEREKNEARKSFFLLLARHHCIQLVQLFDILTSDRKENMNEPISVQTKDEVSEELVSKDCERKKG
jgi:hypothetical protein